MSSSELVNFLPEKLRNYAYTVLQNASAELYDYLMDNRIEITSEERNQVILLALVNFVRQTFISSRRYYENAFRYLRNKEVDGFTRGADIFTEDDRFTSDWLEVEHDWDRLILRFEGLPGLFTIQGAVQWVIGLRRRG